MTIRYLNNEINLTEDGTYRPNTLIINGELASMERHASRYGYDWKATTSGNVLCYRTESGMDYNIPQKRLQETFQDELREAMQSAGLNLKAAAELCEIPYRTMQDWRAGRRIPPKAMQKAVISKLEESR